MNSSTDSDFDPTMVSGCNFFDEAMWSYGALAETADEHFQSLPPRIPTNANENFQDTTTANSMTGLYANDPGPSVHAIPSPFVANGPLANTATTEHYTVAHRPRSASRKRPSSRSSTPRPRHPRSRQPSTGSIKRTYTTPQRKDEEHSSSPASSGHGYGQGGDTPGAMSPYA